MKRIGGNVEAVIQTRTVLTDDIGEQSETWTLAIKVKGFLDYA